MSRFIVSVQLQAQSANLDLLRHVIINTEIYTAKVLIRIVLLNNTVIPHICPDNMNLFN